MTIAYIEYPTLEDATARDAEFWAAVRGPGWQPGNVTQYVYGRRVRTGDEEQDAGLPPTGDYFITAIQDDDLDTLILQEDLTLAEYEALIILYEQWDGDGVQYYAGNSERVQSIVQYNSQLWKCIQSHVSQVDWEPGVAISLWTLAVPRGVIPEWIQPNGAHDAYALNALVTHAGYIWQSTIPANVWEPGSVGAENLWTQLEEV